jgi:hypothetical protein
MERAPEILAESPQISTADVLVAKLPRIPVAVSEVLTGDGSDR